MVFVYLSHYFGVLQTQRGGGGGQERLMNNSQSCLKLSLEKTFIDKK